MRGGVQWSVSKSIRLGFSAQTRMWMTKFDKYSGLFADQGAFNIPANLTAGVAVDAMPGSDVDGRLQAHLLRQHPVGREFVGDSDCAFGASDGPGFGWHDVDVVKIGAEWRASPAWTLRAGYAHNTNPIKSTDVTLNIIAPGVVTDHITGGFSYQINKNYDL